MISFKAYLTEETNISLDITEEDIESIVNSLEWDDIYDLYESEELVEDEEEIQEALTIQSRLKRGQRARRSKTKLAMARRLRLRRPSNMNVLRNRAKIAARRMLMKRFLRNRNKKYISAQEKNRIEAQISNMGSIVTNLSTRLLPKMRDIERKRLINVRKKQVKAR